MLRVPPPSSARTPRPAYSGSDSTPLDDRIAGFETQLDQLRAQVRQAQQLAHMGIAAPMIAHEVNNLLTPVLSYAIYAADCPDVALKDKALAVVIKNVKMLVNMTERVLQVSAAKTSEPSQCPLRETAVDAMESMCRNPDKDGIQVSIDIEESSVAWCDPLQLQQVMFNLFLNARNAMAKQHGGRLTVQARRDGAESVITVEDSGGGIPEDLLPYVFDPLQSSKKRGDNGSHRCSGLGLALCRDLIAENNGRLEVQNIAGQGAQFTIRLPAQPPQSS